jgi:serine/threonine protein phosphatase PrpC
MMLQDPEQTTLSVETRGLYALVAPLTDVGRKREHNEDHHLVLPLAGGVAPQDGDASTVALREPGVLLVVADGMGGHHGGEVASRVCVETLAKEIVPLLLPSGAARPDVPAALQRAVTAAHQALFNYAQKFPTHETMGTTLTAALVCGTRADVAQVGDSRAYLLRDGNLILLTQDQTIGNQLRKRGQDPALVNPRIAELLTQAVGAQAEIKVIMTAIDLVAQDLLVLCSDGLYKAVSPAELVQILEMSIPLSEKARRLIARGNENGGPDNITVILVELFPTRRRT